MTAPGTNPDIVWLDDIGVADVDRAGGKGANLGELVGAGLRVPPGFVVTAGAYRRAAEAAGVRDELNALRRATWRSTTPRRSKWRARRSPP